MIRHIFKQLSRQRALENSTSARKGLFQQNRPVADHQATILLNMRPTGCGDAGGRAPTVGALGDARRSC